MKATELMIGDWLNTNRSECVADYAYQKWQQVGKVKYTQEDVVAVRFDDEDDWEEFSLNEVNPIPLTEEILVKNGWRKEPITIDGDYANWHGEIPICQEEDEFNYERIELIYVHQLQHLLRLCGIEKEIEL